jgi:hypothetical protein
MQPHEQRVVEEKRELDERLNKLLMFIGANPLFKELTERERARLEHQAGIMNEYSRVLKERIAEFPA